MFQHCR